MAKNKLKFKVGESVLVSLSRCRREPTSTRVRDHLDRSPEEHRVGVVIEISRVCTGYTYWIKLPYVCEDHSYRGPPYLYFYCSARELSLFHEKEEPFQLCLF